MSLEEHRVVFMVVTGVLVLLVASPALSRLLVFPRTEFFTELWLLGPNHMAEDYPFNVTVSEKYNLFLGIGNRLGYAAYYKVAVKLRNQTQSAPDSFNRTFSSLPAVYEIRAFVADEATWEIPLSFSFDYGYNETRLQVDVHSMTLNGVVLEMENCEIAWDQENNGFLGNLFFELWIYNATTNGFQYHERFVSLWLNMTGS